MKHETLHICVAADDNYILPLGTFINSIIRNCTTDKWIVHILETNIPQKTQNKLHKLCRNTNVCLNFINMDKYTFDFQRLDMKHWTKAIFYRIMIPEIFQHLDRIIYIDCDTLVLCDLHDLYYTDIPDDKYVAMVSDKYSFLNRREYLKLTSYYNSGMIVFDTARCRQFNFCKKCIQWIHDFPQYAKYPDQDAINIVLREHILRLDNTYNWQIVSFQGHQFKKLDSEPHILHFLTQIKAWHSKTDKILGMLYEQYIPYTRDYIFVWLKHRLCWTGRQIWSNEETTQLFKGHMYKYKKFFFFKIPIYKKRMHIEETDMVSYLKFLRGKTNYGQ